MSILDEGDFNKQAGAGNRKYKEMADRGDDYLVIRKTAVKDGLEGQELIDVMSMVDSVLAMSQHKNWHKDTKIVMIVIGIFALLGGMFFIYYAWNRSIRGVLFGVGLLVTGGVMILRGNDWD